ncbi:hypothetical protein QOT17_023870 [Balamuthia mandrillaris]
MQYKSQAMITRGQQWRLPTRTNASRTGEFGVILVHWYHPNSDQLQQPDPLIGEQNLGRSNSTAILLRG